MRTVKEISDLTGISVRTLHYQRRNRAAAAYAKKVKRDTGFMTIKCWNACGRFFFFREFEIPLKEIKKILDQPFFDQTEILQMQRKMLVAKKERMERLISSIDDILKGDNKMDFAIFSKAEIEEMFQTMFDNMPDNMRELAVKEFGSVGEWKKHYMEVVSSEKMQKGYAKVVEWYGGKDNFLSVANNPISTEVALL